MPAEDSGHADGGQEIDRTRTPADRDVAREERTFLAELQAHDIPVSPYNLPDWDDTRAGLHACLNSLFRHTPPSALIIGDVPLLFPVHQFLASWGIRVPAQVPLLSLDPDLYFRGAIPSFPISIGATPEWCGRS